MLRHLATALLCALFILVTGFPAQISKQPGANASKTPAARLVRTKDQTERVDPVGVVEPIARVLGHLKSVPASMSDVASIAEPPQEHDIGAALDAALDPELEQTEPARRQLSHGEICQVLKEAATENELPVPLFTRLIWQESRFRTEVVSHAGARGIAQFMPGTAAERGLEDPLDPIQALPASADFLRELVEQFGNFGLAAAAYNGGPRRVSDWLAGKGGLPKETREYVVHITGLRAEDWAEATTYAEPHPETFKVQDCNVRPLRAARATLKEMSKLAATAEAAKPAKSAQASSQEKEAQASSKEKEAKTSSKQKEAKTSSKQKEAKASPKEKEKERPAWGVQLAAHLSEQLAAAGFKALQKKYPRILAQHKPTIVKKKVAGKGSTPRALVRIAAETKSEAQGLCNQLKKAGGSCIVMKNDDQPSQVAGS